MLRILKASDLQAFVTHHTSLKKKKVQYTGFIKALLVSIHHTSSNNIVQYFIHTDKGPY